MTNFTNFHLTAKPANVVTVTPSQILSVVEGEVRYFADLQSSDGSIPVIVSATATFAYGGATLVAAGDTTYLSQTIKAMDWSASNYASTGGSSTDGPEFEMGPIAKAYALLAASGKVSDSQLAAWKSDLTAIKYTPGNAAHNWGAYAMDGAWQMAKAGLVGTAAAQKTIESLWATYQKADFDTANSLYTDKSTSPDSMSVEAAGRGRILDLVLSGGYNGPSAAAMKALVMQGTATSLTLQDPSGQAPTGGRTSDHVWVDAGYQSIFEAAAQTTSDATLAGQYQEAANLTFTEMQRWKNADGSFQVTKNEYPDSARVGYQTASTYSGYNGNVLLGEAEAYNADDKTITPVSAPVQIGGYSYYTGSDWSTAFAGAGGTAVEIELAGSSAYTFSSYWSALGIGRIGTADFDTRLGPSDGKFTGSDGVSFAPTWQNSSGSWVHLAGQPNTYGGTFTTVVASPVLTIDRIVWAPNNGASGPTFTQTIDITTDGIFSKVTESGATGAWGMTLPLLASDGKTTLSQSLSGGIASVSGYGSTESFIALDPTTVLTAGSNILSSYGEVDPVRAVGSSSEQDTFVYQGQDGISAVSVKAGFHVTATGYTSSIGWVDGTLYSGKTSAGGFGSAISLDDSGAPDATFSTACNFILQVSNGVITHVEADRPVTAKIDGKTYSLGAYSPQTVSGGNAPPVTPPVVPPVTPPVSGVAAITVVQPSVLAVGQDTFTATVKSGTPTSVQLAWHTIGNDPNGSGDYVQAVRQANGTYKAIVTVDHPGVVSSLFADVNGNATKLWSMAPIIPPTPVVPPPVVPPITTGADHFVATVTKGAPTSVMLAWHTIGNDPNGSGDYVQAVRQANGTYTATVTVDHPGVQSTLWADVDGKVSALWSITPSAATGATTATTIAAAAAPSLASALTSVQSANGGAAQDFAATAASASTAQSAVVPHATSANASALMLADVASHVAVIATTSHETMHLV